MLVAPDGTLLVLAAAGQQLHAVHRVTGQVAATADLGAAGRVSRLSIGPGGEVAALLTNDGQGSALARFDAALQPDGDPVPLLPKEATRPRDVQLRDDGTAVVTLATADSGRLLVLDGGDVGLTVDLGRAADSGLDLTLSPDARFATVPLAALQELPRVSTFDLTSCDEVGSTALCDAFGDFGDTAASADGETLVVTGLCLADHTTRAFLLG